MPSVLDTLEGSEGRFADECLRTNRRVVKWQPLPANNLFAFVTFAGDEDDIARLGQPNGSLDRLTTIEFCFDEHRTIDPGTHLFGDDRRVFSPWIVGGEDHMICR